MNTIRKYDTNMEITSAKQILEYSMLMSVFENIKIYAEFETSELNEE